jgi:hypothetical protein
MASNTQMALHLNETLSPQKWNRVCTGDARMPKLWMTLILKAQESLKHWALW